MSIAQLDMTLNVLGLSSLESQGADNDITHKIKGRDYCIWAVGTDLQRASICIRAS